MAFLADGVVVTTSAYLRYYRFDEEYTVWYTKHAGYLSFRPARIDSTVIYLAVSGDNPGLIIYDAFSGTLLEKISTTASSYCTPALSDTLNMVFITTTDGFAHAMCRYPLGYNSTFGVCTDCEIPFFTQNGGVCSLCPKGKYVTDGRCVECDDGYYSDAEDSPSCKPQCTSALRTKDSKTEELQCPLELSSFLISIVCLALTAIFFLIYYPTGRIWWVAVYKGKIFITSIRCLYSELSKRIEAMADRGLVSRRAVDESRNQSRTGKVLRVLLFIATSLFLLAITILVNLGAFLLKSYFVALIIARGIKLGWGLDVAEQAAAATQQLLSRMNMEKVVVVFYPFFLCDFKTGHSRT